MRKACLNSSAVFAQTFGARGGDEFGLHRVQHSFAHQARDFAGKKQAERDGRQNHVPGRFPQRRRAASFNLMAKIKIKQRRDHKARHAHGQHGQKTAGIIRPAPAPGGGEKSDRQARPHGETKRQRAERHRNRQSLRDDVVDGVVAVFERDAEIAVRQIAQIADVLFPDRLIEMIFRLEVALDFRRRRRAFTVERPAGREMHQAERQRADDQQQRNRRKT